MSGVFSQVLLGWLNISLNLCSPATSEENHFSHLYLLCCSFSHCPQCMTKGDRRNMDQMENREPAQPVVLIHLSIPCSILLPLMNKTLDPPTEAALHPQLGERISPFLDRERRRQIWRCCEPLEPGSHPEATKPDPLPLHLSAELRNLQNRWQRSSLMDSISHPEHCWGLPTMSSQCCWRMSTKTAPRFPKP